jgi:hypothetical protein
VCKSMRSETSGRTPWPLDIGTIPQAVTVPRSSMVPLALRLLLHLRHPDVAVCRQTRQEIAKVVAAMPPGATIAGPIRRQWLESVTPILHSFANILRTHDRIMVVRSAGSAPVSQRRNCTLPPNVHAVDCDDDPCGLPSPALP